MMLKLCEVLPFSRRENPNDAPMIIPSGKNQKVHCYNHSIKGTSHPTANHLGNSKKNLQLRICGDFHHQNLWFQPSSNHEQSNDHPMWRPHHWVIHSRRSKAVCGPIRHQQNAEFLDRKLRFENGGKSGSGGLI